MRNSISWLFETEFSEVVEECPYKNLLVHVILQALKDYIHLTDIKGKWERKYQIKVGLEFTPEALEESAEEFLFKSEDFITFCEYLNPDGEGLADKIRKKAKELKDNPDGFHLQRVRVNSRLE